MTIRRMDDVGIVVDDLDDGIAFFAELGMEREGKARIEGLWADRPVGLDGVRSVIAMMRTPDGHSELELTKYHTPAASGARSLNPPPNTLGLHRVMFAVDDIDDTVARLRPGRTAQLTACRGRPATNQNDPLDGPRTTTGGITVQPNEITEVLNRPISQELLARDVTRLAYVAKDGTPRNVPIAFTWNGSEIVMCTSKNAPKLRALRNNPTVALTIDTEVHPPKILLIRGQAELDFVDGIPDEYLQATSTYEMTPEQRGGGERADRSPSQHG